MEFNFGNFSQGSLFGNMESSVEALAKKQEETKKQKAEKKTDTKKKTGKSAVKAKDEEITCPVNVFTPYGVFTANEAEGFAEKAKISELTEWLIGKGFEALQTAFVDLAFIEGNVYMTFHSSGAHKGATMIQWGEDGGASLTVADGMLCHYFTKDLFQEEEVSVEELATKFREMETQYADSELVYDPMSNVAVVVSKNYLPKAAKNSKEKVHSTEVAGEDYLEGDMSGTIGELATAFVEAHPEYEAVENSLSFMLVNDQYLPIVIKAPTHDKSRYALKGNQGKVVEKQKKYKVPVVVRTIFGKFELTAEGLGKEAVTCDEVKEYLKSSYDEFRNKKFLLEYIDGAECFQALVYSSQKGATEEKRADFPVGSFYFSDSELKSFSFNREMKIPKELLEEVLAFFKQDLENEAVVQIWHRKGAGCFIHYPEVKKVNNCYIEYTNAEVKEYILDDNVELVATIHSHNRMKAIFSIVDDADELYPGVYAVIGNLDSEIPSISVRAGINGQFTYLDYSEVFDTDRAFKQFQK